MAKLQVQVAPEGRQVQQQGALARPDARGGGGRAGTPALSGPGGAGQRRQVHVVGTHPPRQHHLHVGRRVADSCGERRDASARRGPPGRPPSLRPPAAHGVQRWARRASTGTTGPERALPSLPSPRHLRAGQLLRPGPAPPGKGSSAAAPTTSGDGGAASAPGDPAAARPPGSRLEPGPPAAARSPSAPSAVSGPPPNPGRAGRRGPPGRLGRAGGRWPREARARRGRWARERYLCPGPVPKPAAAARAGREEAAGRRHTWYLGGAAPRTVAAEQERARRRRQPE